MGVAGGRRGLAVAKETPDYGKGQARSGSDAGVAVP